jgi:murein DD-endopeptidase MepM/ murein hydrolase activator NlpD
MADDTCSPAQSRVEVRPAKTLLIIYYLITLHLVAVFLIIDEISLRYTLEPKAPGEPTNMPEPAPSAAASSPTPTIEVRPSPGPTSMSGLIIPVQGVRPGQLTDSFADARSEGRVHDAIDIMAPAGTPVLAAADGEIVKFHDSRQGGTTIYELGSDGRTVFYYAHLQRRAEDLRENEPVRQGRLIGYVGDTGNAGPGNYHLHFAMWTVSDPKHFWNGESVNPYPLLSR